MRSPSLRKKLFFTFFCVLLATFATYGFSFYQQIASEKIASQVSETWLPAVSKSSELTVNVANYRRLEVQMTYSEDKADQAQIRGELDSATQNLMIYRNVFEPFLITQEQQDLYAKFSDNWDQYMEIHQKIEDALKKDDQTGAEKILVAESQDAFKKTYESLIKLGDSCFGSGIAASDSLRRNFKQVKFLTLTAMAFSLIFGFIMLFWIVRNITTSLSRISEAISESTSTVADSSNSLSGASNQLSGSVTSAAASIEETVASVEELSSIAKLNATNSQQASELAVRCQNSVNESQVKIQSLIQTMNENYKNSVQMQEILNMIDDIAFQTNLLALNASVEAARAGEHGRGFAVVAEAVRSLAQRSAVSAKEISDLLKNALAKMKTGVDLAADSETSFTEIVKYVEQIKDINTRIAEGSGEQNVGIQQIATAMSTIDSSSQQNAKTAIDIDGSAHTVNEQARLLEQNVVSLRTIIHGRRRVRDVVDAAPQLPANSAALDFENEHTNKAS